MADTYLALHYHIVFSTRCRRPFIQRTWRPRFHEYIGGTIYTLGGVPHCIGGVEDHIHILVELNAMHRLADVMREVKKASTAWVQREIGIRNFAWQNGYGAFTVGRRELHIVRRYIDRQEVHHRKQSSLEEIGVMLARAHIDYNPKYLD